MKTILLVEDDIDINAIVCELLRGENYEVVCTFNGEEAWKLLSDGMRPSLILTDIMMPIMDGFELIERVSTIIPWKDIKIIAATASTSIKKRLDSHCVCIAKPYDLDKLLNTIEEALCTETQS